MRVPQFGRHRRRDAAERRYHGVIAGLTTLLLVLPTPSLGDLPPPIFVTIDGRSQPVPPGVTVEHVSRLFRLRPRAGALLDIVEGRPLERRKYPGHLALNGRRARAADVLSSGDELKVVDGRDRYEPIEYEIRRISGGHIENPQTHLGSTRGRLVITKGSISGKLVSSVFRPIGAVDVPDAVALTFDDGPHPTYTPRILRVLRQHDVKATFFTLGYLVRRYPEIVGRLRRAGMAFGNHSLNHPQSPPFAQLPTDRMREEILGGRRALIEAGAESDTFRPPGGSWNARVVRRAEAVGERTVLWSVDSRDWTGASPNAIAKNVLRSVGPGSIVLLHDGGDDGARTAAALPRIIRGIRAMGLEFATL